MDVVSKLIDCRCNCDFSRVLGKVIMQELWPSPIMAARAREKLEKGGTSKTAVNERTEQFT